MKAAEYRTLFINQLKEDTTVKNLVIEEFNNHTFITFELINSKLSTENRPCLVVFNNKKKRYILNCGYLSFENRNRAIKGQKADILRTIQQEKKYFEERQAENDSIQKDTILYSSWGYEQTNIDFYIVLERKGQSVTLQKIGKEITKRNYNDSGKCIADASIRIGEPFKKRLSKYGGIALNSYANAKVYDGKELYWSNYG